MIKATVSKKDGNRVTIVLDELGIQKEASVLRHTKNIEVGNKVICLMAADMEDIVVIGVVES